MARLKQLLEAVLRDAGLPVVRGGVEVFPSTSNGRVLGSLGGCTVWNRSLTEQSWQNPRRFVRALLDAEPIDIESRFGGRVVSAISRRSSGKGRVRRSREEAKEVAELWTKGVPGKGQRYAAYPLLVQDCFWRGMTEHETLDKLKVWIQKGGINRSASSPRREIRDLPSRVARLYQQAQAYRRPTIRPQHLSGREIAGIVLWTAKLCDRDDERAELACFLFVALSFWKGVWTDKIKAKIGYRFPLHSSRWERFAWPYPGRAARLRDLSGLWMAGNYVTAAAGAEEAHALTYICLFPFDPTTPRRTLLLPQRSRSPGGGGPLGGKNRQRRQLRYAVDLSIRYCSEHGPAQAHEMLALYGKTSGHSKEVSKRGGREGVERTGQGIEGSETTDLPMGDLKAEEIQRIKRIGARPRGGRARALGEAWTRALIEAEPWYPWPADPRG